MDSRRIRRPSKGDPGQELGEPADPGLEAEEPAGSRTILLLIVAAGRRHVEIGVFFAAEGRARDFARRESHPALLDAFRRIAHETAPVPARAPDIPLRI